MSLFFESIKLLDGEFYLLDLHQDRIDRTVLAHFNKICKINLKKELSEISPPQKGLFKVRVSYDEKIQSIEIDEYSLKSHTKIEIIQKNDLNYAFKSKNREHLSFNSKEAEDAIFIKNNHICDATYSNVILFDGQNWFTPDTFLLAGVKRAYLISQKKISPKQILLEDLEKYSQIAFINAMRDFEKTYTFVKNGHIITLEPVK